MNLQNLAGVKVGILLLKEEQLALRSSDNATEYALDLHCQKVFKFLEEVVSIYGAISLSKFDGEACSNAWFLIQNLDKFVGFQERYLDLMLEDPINFFPAETAYLIDRVLVNKGKIQVYGTQFAHAGNGVFKPKRTIEPKYVNKRRADVGLNTLEEYSKKWGKVDLSDFYC